MKKIFLSLFLFAFSIELFAQINADAIMPDHPRILMLKGEEKNVIKNITGDKTWQKIQQYALIGADSLLHKEPLQRIIIGKRLLETSREAFFRVFLLSYAYRTTGDVKYASHAEREMLSLCYFPDWNPSHFLDVAEMTTAISIGYDWLYDYLPQSSKKIIRDAIVHKGLMPSMDSEYNGWLKRHNNWNQVCNASMTLGALAVWEENTTLSAQIINRSIESIKLPMSMYSPDGTYPEGYGYWHYGTTYNVLFLSAIERVFGSDFGLSQAPGFMNSPNFVLNMVGQDEKPFNFGDSGGGLRLNTSLFWFADKLNNTGLIRLELAQLLKPETYFYEGNNRALPALFVWGTKIKIDNLPAPAQNMFVGAGETPVCLMRSGWDERKDIYLAVKGGSPSSNTHNHLDEGSFVMDAMGVRWALDFGPQSYNTIESKGINLWDNTQDGQRWSVFRYNNFAHNVISVDNKLLDVKGRAEIESWSDNPAFMFGTLNTTSFYHGHLKSAKRGLAIVEGKYVQVQDELQAGDKSVNVQWRMATPAKVSIKGNKIVLTQQGKKMRLEVISKIPVTLKTWSTQPSNDYDEENPNTIIVGYEMQIPANSTETVIVRLIPSKEKKQKLVLTPIDNWK